MNGLVEVLELFYRYFALKAIILFRNTISKVIQIILRFPIIKLYIIMFVIAPAVFIVWIYNDAIKLILYYKEKLWMLLIEVYVRIEGLFKSRKHHRERNDTNSSSQSRSSQSKRFFIEDDALMSSNSSGSFNKSSSSSNLTMSNQIFVLRTNEARFLCLSRVPKSFYFKFHRFKIHYWDSDPNSNRKNIAICLHGTLNWSYSFRNTVDRLHDKGYRVIALDFIGFGKSDKHSLSLTLYEWIELHSQTLSFFIKDILKVGKNHHCILIAHEFSALIATKTLKANFDLDSPPNFSLVLVNPWFSVDAVSLSSFLSVTLWCSFILLNHSIGKTFPFTFFLTFIANVYSKPSLPKARKNSLNLSGMPDGIRKPYKPLYDQIYDQIMHMKESMVNAKAYEAPYPTTRYENAFKVWHFYLLASKIPFQSLHYQDEIFHFLQTEYKDKVLIINGENLPDFVKVITPRNINDYFFIPEYVEFKDCGYLPMEEASDQFCNVIHDFIINK
jgi:pimeloyl-ACP methyl ester carboxylesterase